MISEDTLDAASSTPVDALTWAPPAAPLDMPRQVLEIRSRWTLSHWLASLFRPLRLG